ncbi:MAG: class I SAM-dependent methyltransferase, partial [Patescibacteria group bacterium]
MAGIINKLHQSRFFGKVFHTLIYCLQKELKDCETVLDLGCGPNSPIKYCKGIKYSVGVEVFKPYLIESKKRKIHTKYLNQKIEEVDFPEKSFDAVILIEVLEHLSEKQGREILKKAEKWAKKKVVVSSPNGFINQKEVDGNKYQKHLSGGSLQRMRDLGYESRGLAGLKFLRQEVQSDTMGDDLLTSIRFRPKFFWFMVATLSQTFSYFLPQVAFELFSVKRKKVLLLSRPFGGFKHVYAGEQSTARSIYSVLNKDFAVDSVKALIVPPHSSVLSLIFYDWIYPFYFSLKNLFNRYSVVVFNAPFQALAIDLFK